MRQMLNNKVSRPLEVLTLPSTPLSLWLWMDDPQARGPSNALKDPTTYLWPRWVSLVHGYQIRSVSALCGVIAPSMEALTWISAGNGSRVKTGAINMAKKIKKITVYIVLAKEYTSIALVWTKYRGSSHSGKSSSRALNIQPCGTGHAPLYASFDSCACKPTSVRKARLSSAIIIFDW